MKPEQIHDALNLLDEDMIEAVDALRDKSKRKIPWMKYLSVAACLCVAVIGAFVWIHYEGNNSAKNTYDGMSDTEGTDKGTESNTSNDGLAGDAPDQDLDGKVPDGAVEGGVSLEEVPSVLVRIDTWQEDGFEGIVAGIVDTDIFTEGTKIKVLFNENISVGIQAEDSMKYEEGAPDKDDFPIGSIVRVQFVKFEHATEGETDITGQENVIYAELIAPADSGNK